MQYAEPITLLNIEAAFAGESMAHIKYRYFAQLARELGDEATAGVFEKTAAQEVLHAFSHLDLLYPRAEMDVKTCLNIAIEGEIHEYTEMYPTFRHVAELERNASAVAEFDEQISESKEHARRFQETLEKAVRRFAALTRIEEGHANNYRARLAGILP